MKRIEFKDGKLYTEVRFKFQGKVTKANNIIIDTNSAGTVISKKTAIKLGIEKDESTFYEVLDSLSVGPLKVSEFQITISDIEEDGVLGLDFMKKVGAKINLDAMTISSSRT
ncbi:aspartyl protease family protein [Salipaludibacillus agaradhaerens]|uniref:aspartyl protease family protein n=1 Tax=Salipaludibacillus agaradhaerens TaxID=76935 RepID=UPI00215197B9|nr:aspartyl protease family protein [Salipaludibacillus agaradhaerens]MCR6106727.1 aspartyl protease family protein [Salipaludibacillus agaradhaerens]MCR6118760.1 aspartyl protease family protein [Salipaludibacillus agaradhaerens]UJW57839.1 aspartyl protease family protein [Bacillus sp. A116_S68]